MLYRQSDYSGEAARAAAQRPQPFGVGITDPAIDRLEVWCTDFSDPSEYCEFRLFDAAGQSLGVHRIAGY